MNIQFENKYYSTDKMLSEYTYKVIFKKQRTTAFIFSLVNILTLALYQGSHVISTILGNTRKY